MRKILHAFFLTLLVAIGLPQAWAQDPCNPAGGNCVVDDLQSAADTADSAAEQWSLPAGALSAADLERAFQEVMKRDKGVMGFFGLLADGQARTLGGDVVRAMFTKYGVKLDFLPLDALQRVEAAGGKVTFHFDFGREGHRDIQLPGSSQKVLDSRHRSDPWLVDRKNRVRDEVSKGQKLRLQDELQFSVNQQGLTGLREGDLAVHHWLAGWVNMDLHSERHPDRVATGEKDRPVLRTDSRGNPVVDNGRYVPQRYDDWVIITAAGRRIEVGVPPLRGDD
jgi:hypothetical protein